MTVQDDSEDGDDNIDEESFAPLHEATGYELVQEDEAGNSIIFAHTNLLFVDHLFIHFV